MANGPVYIKLDDGWASLQKGITKLKNLLDGGPELTPEEYMSMYTIVYNMCAPQRFLQQLFNRYKGIFEDYISTTVLPALREQSDEQLLREFVKRWDNHKIMAKWLSHIFNILDRRLIEGRSPGSMREVGLLCFRDKAYAAVKSEINTTVMAQIDRERDGEQIDQTLIENVVAVFVEMGLGTMDVYEGDFEVAMLAVSAAYYFRKAASWIEKESHSDYTLKAEECLVGEKEMARRYLPASSEPKLLEKLQHELFTRFEAQLLEEQTSSSHALLKDDKVQEDS